VCNDAKREQMSPPVNDLSELPGKTVLDQYGEPVGEISEIFAIGGESHPSWATVEFRGASDEPRTVYIPLARLKHKHGSRYVSYNIDNIPSYSAHAPDAAA
jgi:hypothetical protein